MKDETKGNILIVSIVVSMLIAFGAGVIAVIIDSQREQDKQWSANAAARAACVDMGGLALPATGEVTQCVLPCQAPPVGGAWGVK